MMQEVRVAINYQKILDAKLDTEIARDQVKRLVKQGANVTQALIHEINTAKEEGKDPANHMEAILEDNGRLQGLKSPADKREAVLKAFRNFAELTGRVSGDPEYLEALNNEQIEELMNKLEMLQEKMNPDQEDALDPWDEPGENVSLPLPASRDLQNPGDEPGTTESINA
jgi:predicted  nucleic acid-binding Zn-ribbon protein